MFKPIPTGHAQADAIAAEHGEDIAAKKLSNKQICERFGCSDWCARKVRVATGLSVADPSTARQKWREGRKGGRTQQERQDLKVAGDGDDSKGTSYTLDAFGACYVFTFPASKHVPPLKLPKKAVDALLMDYSNHGGKMTAREVATAWGLPRWQAVAIIRALGFVKSGVPFSDERLSEAVVDLDAGAAQELHSQWVAALSQQTEAKVERSLDHQIRKDAMKWREQEVSVLQWATTACNGLRTAVESWKPPRRRRAASGSKCALVVGLTDLHIGSVSWVDPARPSLENCRKQLQSAISDMLLRLPAGHTPEKIYLPIGGDLFHTDNMHSATTKGTAQQMGATEEQMVAAAFQLLPMVILALAEVAPVEAVLCAGNHDAILSIAAWNMLVQVFHSHPRITVSTSDAEDPYQVKRYGTNLIGFHHGHGTHKPKDLGLIMAEVAREDWSTTTQRAWFVGHRHSDMLQEDFGISVYTMPSLCPTKDRYHRLKYRGTQRRAIKGAVFDPADGVVATLYGYPR